MKTPQPKPAVQPIPPCGWSDDATGECCMKDGPFGYGPPRLVTTIHACADHRPWAETIFRERKNG